MNRTAIRITGLADVDRLSSLLQHTRHLHIKIPVNRRYFMPPTAVDLSRFTVLYYAVSNCRVLTSIEFRTDYVELTANDGGKVSCDNIEDLFKSAMKNLLNVRRISASQHSSLLLSSALLQLLRACCNLEELEIELRRCEEELPMDSVLANVGPRLRVLHIRFATGSDFSSPVPLTLFTKLAERGVQLRRLEVAREFSECTSDLFLTDLRNLRAAHPHVSLKLSIKMKKEELHLGIHRCISQFLLPKRFPAFLIRDFLG